MCIIIYREDGSLFFSVGDALKYQYRLGEQARGLGYWGVVSIFLLRRYYKGE